MLETLYHKSYPNTWVYMLFDITQLYVVCAFMFAIKLLIYAMFPSNVIFFSFIKINQNIIIGTV